MKRLIFLTMTILFFPPLFAEQSCFDKVEIGDPMPYVIERCGEPVRRERDIYLPSQSVEVIRGSDTLRRHPVQPQRMEKWYYDTSLDRATLIEILDGGVLNKRRLKRETDSPTMME